VLALAVVSQSSMFGGKELHSPSDWVQEEQIKVYPNQIILDIKGATWAGFTNTNSMDPFIDETSNAIEIIPGDPDAIEIGDVISYQTNYGVVIHRVIQKGRDRKGVFYIVQGDNNSFRDPFKVRYEDVKGVVVAVIY
jgi:signal peptidase I